MSPRRVPKSSLAIAGVSEESELHRLLADNEMESPEQYGSAKAACEQAVLMELGLERSVIVHPCLIGGPGDQSECDAFFRCGGEESLDSGGDVPASQVFADRDAMDSVPCRARADQIAAQVLSDKSQDLALAEAGGSLPN